MATAPIKILKDIERAGRVCYKSENNITDDSCITFCKNIIASKANINPITSSFLFSFKNFHMVFITIFTSNQYKYI